MMTPDERRIRAAVEVMHEAVLSFWDFVADYEELRQAFKTVGTELEEAIRELREVSDE